MGLLMSIRRRLGLPKEDGGFASALWNVGQLERYGSVVHERPFDIGPVADVQLAEDLPWELREAE